jgi:uroporphyrinogen decarboxylase
MTGIERVTNTLNRLPVDRLAVYESFWEETVTRWRREGHITAEENPTDHFNLDIRLGGWPVTLANLDFEDQVVEETESTILKLNGNGATLRWMKEGATTPEHVDFKVKDRISWEEMARPHLTAHMDERRLNAKHYLEGKTAAADKEAFYCWSGVGPFECIHPLCGHEHMLLGMAMDPDWVKDMVMVYSQLTRSILEENFSKHGKPDGVWFYEDMGFKGRPFMSPDMYKEIVQPGHKLLFDYVHSQGLKVIVHSCGFVEPFMPGLIEAGMDCLQAMEVKAGMDVIDLGRRFGKHITFMGGLDIRELISNDKARIDTEMEKKITALQEMGCGYVVHSDHSIPSEVDYESYKYWVEKGRSFITG